MRQTQPNDPVVESRRVTLVTHYSSITFMSSADNFCFPIRDLENEYIKLTPFIVGDLSVSEKSPLTNA